MAMRTRINVFFFLCFFCIHTDALGKDFNVMDFGAKADGKTNNVLAFEKTWNASCGSEGVSTMLIPVGKYLLGPVKFTGPCNSSIRMKMEGHLLADTNIGKFGDKDWILFAWVNGVTIIGKGVFDGQGHATWHVNDCQRNKNCKVLPNNLKFINMSDTTIEGVTSLDSKYFHFGIVDCQRFRVNNIKAIAPEDSPNTDGLHLERCSDVTIQNSVLTTGDDCISLGHDLSNVLISGIKCGPGHGISIGSLGKYPNEKDVKGILVRDSIITGTMNGVRIKTWENARSEPVVSNITFYNIIMKNVSNPIIIDQVYCPTGGCSNAVPSKVKISDVTFKNIRGSSSSEVAVTLECSKTFPCKNIKLEDIDIRSESDLYITSESKGLVPKSICENVKPFYSGFACPPPCN